MAINPQAQTKKLAQKLKQETQLTKQEIRDGVQQTKEKYHPLIQTNKAALIIYAREHTDIQLLDTKPPELDIENIVPEMNQGQITATIKNIDKFKTPVTFLSSIVVQVTNVTNVTSSGY